MKAGAFKYMIELYHRETEVNDYGEEKEEYKLVRKTRAAINFRNNARTSEMAESRFIGVYEMIVRDYVEIDDTSRIVWNGKKYRVVEWHEDLEYRDKYVVVEEINE